MSKIIDDALYFPLGSASLTTPQKFNAIFDSVNDNALGKHNYIPPTQIGVSTNFLFYESANSVSPMVLTMADVTPLPTGWTAAHIWTVESDGSTGGTTGYTPTNASTDTLTLTLTGSDSVSDDSHLLVKLVATYTHATFAPNGLQRVAYAGMPFAKRGLAGADAIQAPQALIYCNAPSQNASYPNGILFWEAKSKSLHPPSTSITAYDWQLDHINDTGGVIQNYDSWLYDDAVYTTPGSGETSQNVYIKSVFGHENKRFRLTLKITDGTGATDTTTVDLFSYSQGTFFYSWDATTVQAPSSVQITASDYSNASSFFLPETGGSINVKWGYNYDDMKIPGSGDKVAVAGGVANVNGVVQAVLDTVLPGEMASDYSLLCMNIDSTGGDVINKYFWAHPMSSSAKIIQKLTQSDIQAAQTIAGSPENFDEAFGDPDIITDTNHIYLLKGDTPNTFWQSDPGMAIGPDAEKYYIYLTEWDAAGSGYIGHRDQSAVVVSKSSGDSGVNAAPAMTEYNFTNVHNGGTYKAEVVANKQGSYSSKIISPHQSFTGGTPHGISSIDVQETGSSCIKLNITTDGGGTEPVGYLVSYKEVAVTSTEGTTAGVASFDANQIDWTVFYTNSKSPKLVGNIGKKLIGEVKAVAQNGTMSSPQYFTPTSIIVDSALAQTGLSKHLGTRTVVTPNPLTDASIPSDLANQLQYNVFKTVFGRDVFIEQMNVWVHAASNTTDGSGNFNAGTIGVQIQVTDQDDHKEVSIDLSDAANKDKLFTVENLSVPVPAGKEVIICLYDPSDTAGGSVLQDYIELSCELFFAHAASSGGGGTGGGGTA